MKRLITLLLVLSMALCLVACGNEEEKAPTATTTTATDPTEPAKPTEPTKPETKPSEPQVTYNYKIRVVDQDGNPIAGAFVIFCLEQCNFYQTNEDGWALIDAAIADGYQAHIMSLPEGYEGYTFSEEYTNFESGQTEMTLVATKP